MTVTTPTAPAPAAAPTPVPSADAAPSTPSLRVAAAIPAYQAAATVGDVVAGARGVVPFVLVVDDGSTDGTADAARAAGADLVLRQPANRGKGAALRLAFAELFARGFDAVVTLDADGQHVPAEIPRLLAAAEATGADLVLGTRDHAFGGGMVWHRQASNRFAAATISRLSRLDVSDVQTGFRLYRRRLVEAVGFPEPRFDAESAVLVRAGRRGFRVATTPVDVAVVDGRRTSHFRPVVDFLRIARGVARTFLAERRRERRR